MESILNTRDIRFPDTRINILLRGGIVSRDALKNSTNSIIDMHDVPFGIAKRINDVTRLDVKQGENVWDSIPCGDEEGLRSAYVCNKEELTESEVVGQMTITEFDNMAADDRVYNEASIDDEYPDQKDEAISDEIKVEETPLVEEAVGETDYTKDDSEVEESEDEVSADEITEAEESEISDAPPTEDMETVDINGGTYPAGDEFQEKEVEELTVTTTSTTVMYNQNQQNNAIRRQVNINNKKKHRH